MARFLRWYLFLTLLAATGARAQVIAFKTGDRLTGKWVSVNAGAIAFDSDAVGRVTIAAAKVKSFAIKQPLVAVLAGGKTISASGARLENGVWTVESLGGERTIAPVDLLEIVPAAAYRAALAERSPWPWRGWKGSANFGYSLQQGDQQAHTLSAGLNAVRRRTDAAGGSDRWRTTYTLNTLFASATNGGERVRSDSLSTTLRQDYFFQSNNFLFVLGQADHIQSQNLYLRQTYGGGYGRDLFGGKRLKASVLAGATFANQKFTGTAADQYAEALVGERVGYPLSRQIRFDHAFNFYPNLTDRGQYRWDTTSTVGFKLNSWLNANMGVIDFYVSQIPAGSSTTVTVIGPGGTVTTTTLPAHNNNLTITAGIGANF